MFMVFHRWLNTDFVIRVANPKNLNPRDQKYQEPKLEGQPGDERGAHSHHLRVKAMNGTAGGREQGGQHFSERKTLNKQEINIQYFYKLQHYETVGHITQKKESTICTILNSEKV